MLDLLGIGEDAKKLWRDVKLLVEQAWTAHDTRQVIALARQALERLGIDPKTSPLRLPTPDTRPEPHESQGRYSFRQEARTPETPHLLAQSVAEDPRDLALYLLVDRSGSMRDCDTQVSLALMSLYLAAMELEIPTGLAFFGAHSDADRERVLEAVASRESDLHEAGIRAWMGSKSPEALSAYLFAAANGKGNVAAWRAFWNAGRIVSLGRDGAKIQSLVTGQVKHTPWRLAALKLKTRELILSKPDRARLKALLKRKGWGAQLIAIL